MVQKRRLSALLTTDDYEQHKHIIQCSEEQILQSGMMLNHCILYRDISFMPRPIQPFGYTKVEENKTAIIVNTIENHKTVERIVTMSEVTSFLTSMTGLFTWIHVIDKRCLQLVASHFSMKPIAMRSFLDTLPRTTFNFFGDDTMLATITSYCQHEDGIICAVKLFMYMCESVVITQERRTYAAMKEVYTDDSGSGAGSIITDDAKLSLKHHRSNAMSLRNVLHTLKASNVREEESKEQHHTAGTTGAYTGRTYQDLCSRINSAPVIQEIERTGPAYFLYEACYVMLEMTAPVISFYSQRQLRLHDMVYVRERPPNHVEGNAILDRVDFIQSGFKLMENLTDRSTKCLVENKEKLAALLPEEWVSDVISSYEHALDVITDMDVELVRITENINGIINRRNEQINIVLSLVATVFLPLTFIAGIFGMNFENGGVLVYMLKQKNGTNWFWGSCAVCVFVCIYIFVSKGWMDMLGKVRRGGHNVATTKKDGDTQITAGQWMKRNFLKLIPFK